MNIKAKEAKDWGSWICMKDSNALVYDCFNEQLVTVTFVVCRQ